MILIGHHKIKGRRMDVKKGLDKKVSNLQYDSYLFMHTVFKTNLCIPESFNSRIYHKFFDCKIAFVTSQHAFRRSKVYFVVEITI